MKKMQTTSINNLWFMEWKMFFFMFCRHKTKKSCCMWKIAWFMLHGYEWYKAKMRKTVTSLIWYEIGRKYKWTLKYSCFAKVFFAVVYFRSWLFGFCWIGNSDLFRNCWESNFSCLSRSAHIKMLTTVAGIF